MYIVTLDCAPKFLPRWIEKPFPCRVVQHTPLRPADGSVALHLLDRRKPNQLTDNISIFIALSSHNQVHFQSKASSFLGLTPAIQNGDSRGDLLP